MVPSRAHLGQANHQRDPAHLLRTGSQPHRFAGVAAEDVRCTWRGADLSLWAAPIGASPQAVADVSDAVLLTCRAVLSVRESHALRAGGDGAAEVEGQATLTSVRELLEQAIALTVAEQSEDYVTYPEEVLQSIEALVDTAAGSMDDLTAQLTGVDVGATPARCACSRRRTG